MTFFPMIDLNFVLRFPWIHLNFHFTAIAMISDEKWETSGWNKSLRDSIEWDGIFFNIKWFTYISCYGLIWNGWKKKLWKLLKQNMPAKQSNQIFCNYSAETFLINMHYFICQESWEKLRGTEYGRNKENQ